MAGQARDWRERLKQLTRITADAPFPLCAFPANAPSGDPWPNGLPSMEAIREFYSLCDGGTFGVNDVWHSLAELPEENEKWFKLLASNSPDGRNLLIRGRHLILGHDSGGAPIIWDSTTDRMATFWFKANNWEETGLSFEEYVTRMLYKDKPGFDGDLWYEALQQLDAVSREK